MHRVVVVRVEPSLIVEVQVEGDVVIGGRTFGSAAPAGRALEGLDLAEAGRPSEEVLTIIARNRARALRSKEHEALQHVELLIWSCGVPVDEERRVAQH